MRDLLTTYHWPLRESWMRRAETVDPARTSRGAMLRRIVVEGPRHRAVVLNAGIGARALYVDLVGAIGLRRLRRRGPRIVLVDATWSAGSRLRRILGRAAVRALDGPQVVYGVLSTAELESFPATWGVARERVRFVPFLYTWTDDELGDVPEGDGSVFAGGDSLRDYGPLIAAAARLDVPVTVATRRTDLPPAAGGDVRIGPLSEVDYRAAARRSSIVVVPIAPGLGRSAGQQTYLNAMAMGKLVVVTDTPGARDYVEDRQTGLVVPPGDADALQRTLAWATDPAHRDEVDAIRLRGRDDVLWRFGPEQHVAAILAIVDEPVDEPGRH